MRNAGLDQSQAGIKIAGRNINNLRYVGDTTNWRNRRGTKKSLLIRVEEESEKSWLKTQHSKKSMIMAFNSITSWQIEGENMEVVTDFIFMGST